MLFDPMFCISCNLNARFIYVALQLQAYFMNGWPLSAVSSTLSTVRPLHDVIYKFFLAKSFCALPARRREAVMVENIMVNKLLLFAFFEKHIKRGMSCSGNKAFTRGSLIHITIISMRGSAQSGVNHQLSSAGRPNASAGPRGVSSVMWYRRAYISALN